MGSNVWTRVGEGLVGSEPTGDLSTHSQKGIRDQLRNLPSPVPFAGHCRHTACIIFAFRVTAVDQV